MEELQKALDNSLSGPLRDEAVAMFLKQMKAWNQALPPCEPLVLDFGLGDFRRIGLIESWIANEVDSGYCGKYLFLFEGQSCPTHRHKSKTETFFMVQGRMKVRCGGKTFEMKPGDVILIKPWEYHCMMGLEPALFLELSQPCFVDDNYFENTSIPIGQNFLGRTR